MGIHKILKALLLNVAIAAVCIIVFSPGLLGISLTKSGAFGMAFGYTVVLISVAAFIYGNYTLFVKGDKPAAEERERVKTKKDYEQELAKYKPYEVRGKVAENLLLQMDSIENKMELLTDNVEKRFSVSELSYKKFMAVTLEVERLFYVNVQSMINRLAVFDEEDYGRTEEKVRAGLLPKHIGKEKMQLFKEQTDYMDSILQGNEKILIRLDKLLIEISKLDSIGEGEMEEMTGILEIDSLISQTQYYK